MSDNRPDDSLMAELAEAIDGGNVGRLHDLLSRHPELRSRLNEQLPGGAFGATALLTAVQRGNRELADALLDAGADIDQRSHWWAGGFGVLDGESPLVDHLVTRGAAVNAYAAARHGWLERLRALLDADPRQARMRGGDGQTPLHVAASVEIASLLLERGAEIDALDVDHESTAAQYLVRDRPAVARFLIAHGARTDLMLAAALGELDLVRRHLDAAPESVGMEVDERWFPRRNPRSGGTIYNWTLGRYWSVHRVAHECGQVEVLELLLARSPDPLRLAAACELRQAEQVDVLLAAQPALRDAVPEELRRRLVNAAQDADLAAVRLFLRAGWPVNSRGQHGATALHWGAFHGHSELVGELLRASPPLELRDDEFQGTPLDWALHGSLHGWRCAEGDYGATVAALLAAGAQRPNRENIAASAAALAALG